MLFDIPLAEIVRPDKIIDMVGIDQIIGKNSFITRMLDNSSLYSLILWGPPGVGKTTLARIIATNSESNFISFSAVMSGINDVKKVMNQADDHLRLFKQKTIIFIDEIHRFNKAQQDAFLPFVETGKIVLIGATTENPSFSIISPLLSRVKVINLKAISIEDLMIVLKRAIDIINKRLEVTINYELELLEGISGLCEGDARRSLGLLELLIEKKISENNYNLVFDDLKTEISQSIPDYDKSGDNHYDYISALHKSMRNSDVDAALFYCMKMLRAGDDPHYIVRRLIQFSSEDVGMADPEALKIAVAAKISLDSMGMPEAILPILQSVCYNSVAPKSNSLYLAMKLIDDDIKKFPGIRVPLHLRNAPTQLMKDLDYGKDYKYAHDYDVPIASMDCMPEQIKGKSYYKPKSFGFEKKISEWVIKIKDIKLKR